MMKVYVINLESRPDRLRHIRTELGRVGVDFLCVPAIDASASGLIADMRDRAASRSGYVISDANLACTLSHHRVWRMHLDSGDDYGVVLEDDVLVSDDFAECLNEDWIPDGADIVKLETFETRAHLGRRPESTLSGRQVHRLLSRHIGAAAYVISRAAAKSLLDYMAPPVDAADEVMFNEDYGWMPQAKIYQVVPAMALQADHRAPERDSPAGFAESSIRARAVNSIAAKTETFPERVLRRMRNEWKAWRIGTSYSVVPFAR